MAHGHGLFSTPDEVRSFEKEKRTAGMTTVNAALFNAGFAGGGAASRFTGGAGNPQSSELTRALGLQEILQGIDFNDRQSVLDAADRLPFQEAAQVRAMAPRGKDTQKTVNLLDDKIIINEDFITGEQTRVAQASPKTVTQGRVDPLAKLNNTFGQSLALSEDGRKTLLNTLQNNKSLTGMFTSVTKEEVADHAGAIVTLGQKFNELEAQAAWAEFNSDKASGLYTDLQARQRLEQRRATPPTETIELMAKLYRESGLMRANSTDSFMGSEEAKIVSAASIPALMKRARVNQRKMDILASKQEAVGGMIQADPNGKGFRMDSIPTVNDNGDGAMQAFSNVGQLSNDDLESYFISKFGANFDNRSSKEWHNSNWDRMRATPVNQQFTKDWFEGTVRERSKLAFDMSKQMWEDQDLDAWADIQLIHQYLSKLTGKGGKIAKEAARVQKTLQTIGSGDAGQA